MKHLLRKLNNEKGAPETVEMGYQVVGNSLLAGGFVEASKHFTVTIKYDPVGRTPSIPL